ncbi:MAG: hypothetical protein HKN68_07500 [Saprospiraceae bacterium]|nr:hypothetical protein [Saprospiraceae bacterium]
MHISFVDDDLYFMTSPYDPSGPIPYWVRNDTLFFGLSHEKDFAILRSNQVIELMDEKFDLLSQKKTDEILYYMDMSPLIRKKASKILEAVHSNIRDFRVGNITISQIKEDNFNELNLEAVCRYRDSNGINRGFEANLSCSIENDKLKIELVD